MCTRLSYGRVLFKERHRPNPEADVWFQFPFFRHGLPNALKPGGKHKGRGQGETNSVTEAKDQAELQELIPCPFFSTLSFSSKTGSVSPGLLMVS